MRMTKFTAALMALSLAVAGTAAAPAKAGDEEIALALGGLLTLFVIGKALEDDKPKSAPVVVEDDTYKHNKNGYKYWKPWPAEKTVPEACIEPVRYQGAREEMALQSCLVRTVPLKNLPRNCDEPVRTRTGGVATAYDLSCMKNSGFKLEREIPRWHAGNGHHR